MTLNIHIPDLKPSEWAHLVTGDLTLGRALAILAALSIVYIVVDSCSTKRRQVKEPASLKRPSRTLREEKKTTD